MKEITIAWKDGYYTDDDPHDDGRSTGITVLHILACTGLSIICAVVLGGMQGVPER